MPTMMMAPDPQKIAKENIRKLIESNQPIAERLSVANREVSISDLAVSIRAFRAQLSWLNAFDFECPVVRLFASEARDPNSVYYVPLDLQIQAGPSHPSRAQIVRAAEGVGTAAHVAGLQVGMAPTKEVTNTVSELMGNIVARRLKEATVGFGNPPEAVFTVTTDSSRVEVLFAKGYFISTRQGFGFSTPARRPLPWGGYIFGHTQSGAARFVDTLWTVPDVQEIHLGV